MTALTGAWDGATRLDADEEIWERRVAENTTWPTTRLARWSLSLLLAMALYFPSLVGRAHLWQWLVCIPLTIVVALVAMTLLGGLDAVAKQRNRVVQAGAVIVSALSGAGMAAVVAMLIGLRFSPVRASTALTFSLLTLAAALGLRAGEIRAQLGLRRVYFVGSRSCALELQRELARRYDRQLVGTTVTRPSVGSSDAAELAADVITSGATLAILDREAMRLEGIGELTHRITRAGLSISQFASFYEAEFKKVPLTEPAAVQAECVSSSELRGGVYRGLEILIAAVLLLGLLPLIAVAALTIRLTSEGPALYRQRRVGRGEIPFTLLKLRTMTTAAGEEPSWSQFHAHRVTWIGRQLRRFRIDELPQLWNVLRGELALIGPRPEQVPIASRMREELPGYQVRHCVRPGLTGWAQVNLGYAGSVEGTLAKLQRDLFYVKRRSLRLDALIIWLTLKTVLSGQGSTHQARDSRRAIDEASEQEARSPRQVHRQEDRRQRDNVGSALSSADSYGLDQDPSAIDP